MLTTKFLHDPDLPKSATELMANARMLIAGGYFSEASRSLRMLVEAGPWQIKKRGSLARELAQLLPMASALADEKSPGVADVAAMSRTEVRAWRREESDSHLAMLATKVRIQLKPAGVGWSEKSLLAIPKLPSAARLNAYRDFLTDAEMIVKVRLDALASARGIADPMAEMLASIREAVPGLADANFSSMMGGLETRIDIAPGADAVSTKIIGQIAAEG